jgi:hypothetical protein
MEYQKNNLSSITEKGFKIFGNPVSFYGQGIVAFIDLLGFAGTVLSNWGEGEDNALKRLLRIKAAIFKEHDHPLFVSCGTDGIPNFAYRCKVRTMSDSVLLFTALPEPLTYPDLSFASISMVVCIRKAWIQAVKEGYTVRGAIELGELYWDEDELIGPAFIRAYNLESRIANLSRVILGSRYVNALIKASERLNIITDAYSPVGFFCKNRDGFISLNPRFLITNKEVDTDDMLRRIHEIRDACLGHKRLPEKYVELIHLLEKENAVQKPTLEDLAAYSKILKKNCPTNE